MNPRLGWGLAVVVIALGYVQYGWRGVLLALSAVVFWLLLQFTRALRAMRAAATAPVGTVASAVMLHARLQKGRRLMDVIQLTRSLGQKVGEAPETWRWRDESGASVEVELVDGRVAGWQLLRPAEPGPGASSP